MPKQDSCRTCLNMSEHEFKINKFISLRLEEGKTKIYINGEYFRHCLALFLNVPVDEYDTLDKINSIDDAAWFLDHQDEKHIQIDPETEFWAHCSNLEVWAENGYDSRLLYSNLAFPMLKRLTKAGYPQARKVFKEEIASRYYHGTNEIRDFLLEEGYLGYITKEELRSFLRSGSDALSKLEQ